MKLLFDQNLSFRLARRLRDPFPNSSQVRLLGLDQAGDVVIWEYAKANAFTLVTPESGFYDRSALFGHPPKVIWLRCGNQATEYVEGLIRARAAEIGAFEQDAAAGCLELY